MQSAECGVNNIPNIQRYSTSVSTNIEKATDLLNLISFYFANEAREIAKGPDITWESATKQFPSLAKNTDFRTFCENIEMKYQKRVFKYEKESKYLVFTFDQINCWLKDISGIANAFAKPLNENNMPADRQYQKLDVSKLDNSQFSKSDLAKFNLQLQNMESHYRSHLSKAFSNIEAMSTTIKKLTETTNLLKTMTDRKSIDLNEVLTANQILRSERDELEAKLAALYTHVLTKEGYGECEIGPLYKPRRVTDVKDFLKGINNLDVPRDPNIPAFEALPNSKDLGGGLSNTAPNEKASDIVSVPKTDPSSSSTASLPVHAETPPISQSIPQIIQPTKPALGKPEVLAPPNKYDPPPVTRHEFEVKEHYDNPNAVSPLTPEEGSKFAQSVREVLTQHSDHMPRPRPRLVERLIPEVGDISEEQARTMVDVSKAKDEATRKKMREAAAAVRDNDQLDDYYTQFWNTQDMPVDEQMLRGFAMPQDARFPAEHFGKTLGFDPTGLPFMEVLKEFEHTKDRCDNKRCPVHGDGKETEKHPAHSYWKTMLDQSDDFVPKTPRIPIAVQRLNGRPVFGPEVPPSMLA